MSTTVGFGVIGRFVLEIVALIVGVWLMRKHQVRLGTLILGGVTVLNGIWFFLAH